MISLPTNIAPGALQGLKVFIAGTPFPNTSSDAVARALAAAGASYLVQPNLADMAIAYDQHERIVTRQHKILHDLPRIGPAAAAAVLSGRVPLLDALRRINDYPLLWKCGVVLAGVPHEDRELVTLAAELAGATVLSGFGHGDRKYVMVVGNADDISDKTRARAYWAGAVRISARDLVDIGTIAARRRIRDALGVATGEVPGLNDVAPPVDQFAPHF